MKTKLKYAVSLFLAALILSGCSMRTVEEMYKLPKRSEDYSNLQTVIDKAMVGLKFAAPLTGDNQQNVQMADLDGDGEQEYLVFAKSNSELPLRILLFDRKDDVFVHFDTIECNGASFDQVEYVSMDKKPGVEVVVGRQVSDQLIRSVSVYTFATGEAQQVLNANYRKFVTVDMEEDGHSELFILRPGQVDNDNGVAELYSMKSGVMERSNEVSMSGPADKLKRVLVGKLQDGKTAIYVASTVGDTSLVTDVYTQTGKLLTNVSLSNETGGGVQTLRNHYIYADDIDGDGVIELPRLVTMIPLEDEPSAVRNELVAWYALNSDGTATDKLFTYYDTTGGWYLKLEKDLALRTTLRQVESNYEFYLWNETYTKAEKLMTIHVLTGQNREEQSIAEDRFVLLKANKAIYSASLTQTAAEHEITQENIILSFSLIHRDWNNGEM